MTTPRVGHPRGLGVGSIQSRPTPEEVDDGGPDLDEPSVAEEEVGRVAEEVAKVGKGRGQPPDGEVGQAQRWLSSRARVVERFLSMRRPVH